MLDPLSIRNKSCVLCPLHEHATSVCVGGEGPSLRSDRFSVEGAALSRDGGSLPVLILGEAPGRDEDSLARPFVGASGKLLRSTLLSVGIPYTQCYITNSVKCFPNGTPKKDEIAICSKNYLAKEIALLRPHYILSLGSTALSTVNPTAKIGESHGKIMECWLGKEKALVFPAWHPAYILRNKSKESEWRHDLEVFRALLETDLKIGLPLEGVDLKIGTR